MAVQQHYVGALQEAMDRHYRVSGWSGCCDGVRADGHANLPGARPTAVGGKAQHRDVSGVGVTPTEQKGYLETQQRVLQSRSLARRVIDQLDLWNAPGFTTAAPEPGSRVFEFFKRERAGHRRQ